MTVASLWSEYKSKFEQVSLSPASDFKWLVSFVLQHEGFIFTFDNQNELTAEQVDQLEGFCRRRSMGEPVAYILNEWDFYGRTFIVNSNVLIPRSETEKVVDICKGLVNSTENIYIADFGTGSGCIAVTLAVELPNSKVLAFEISKGASKVARQNSQKHGVDSKVEVINASVQGYFKKNPMAGEFNFIVANPPYIRHGDPQLRPDVKNFEPSVALYSANSGLLHIEDWVQIAGAALKTSGHFIFEFGKDQESKISEIVTKSGFFDSVEFESDDRGIPRIAICRKM